VDHVDDLDTAGDWRVRLAELRRRYDAPDAPGAVATAPSRAARDDAPSPTPSHPAPSPFDAMSAAAAEPATDEPTSRDPSPVPGRHVLPQDLVTLLATDDVDPVPALTSTSDTPAAESELDGDHGGPNDAIGPAAVVADQPAAVVTDQPAAVVTDQPAAVVADQPAVEVPAVALPLASARAEARAARARQQRRTAKRAAGAGLAVMLAAGGVVSWWQLWAPGPMASVAGTLPAAQTLLDGAAGTVPPVTIPLTLVPTLPGTTAPRPTAPSTTAATTVAPPTAPATLLPTTVDPAPTTLAPAVRDPQSLPATSLPLLAPDGSLNLPTNYGLYQDGILYLVGSVDTQEQADGVMERALAVLPPERISGALSVEPGSGAPSGLVYVPEGVLFDSGSTLIKPDFYDDIDLAVALLNLYPNVTLTIVGHTDNVGSDEYNLELSRQRAQAVVDYAAVTGIDPARLEPLGRGESSPVDTNDTSEGRQRNRRIEVIFNNLLG
jgi:outer membrane protein OmpA-like peptidoglycan-associated protein